MTNDERRQYIIDFMRRHRLNDAELATLIDRDRYWVSRARNNYSRTEHSKGDFRIPRLVTDYLKLIDMLPSRVRSQVLQGEIPATPQEIELVSLSADEIARNKQTLNDAAHIILQRFASILDGSPAEVLHRASTHLISLELTKKRNVSGTLEAAE